MWNSSGGDQARGPARIQGQGAHRTRRLPDDVLQQARGTAPRSAPGSLPDLQAVVAALPFGSSMTDLRHWFASVPFACHKPRPIGLQGTSRVSHSALPKRTHLYFSIHACLL